MNLFSKLKKFSHKKKVPSVPIDYFSISIKRLVFFSWISGGLYQLYWAYKNWQAVKTATQESIIPLFRSWFCNVFWIYPLFRRIHQSSISVIYVSKLYTICALLYMTLIILNIFVLKLPNTASDLIDNIILSVTFASVFGFHFITTLLLIPIQQTINHYRTQNNPKHILLKKITWGEIFTLITGALLFYGIAFYTFEKEENQPLTWEESNQVNFIVTSIYYNTIGYQSFCTKNDYPLQKYPDVFLAAVKNDLISLDQKLTTRHISLQILVDTFEKNNGQTIQNQISQELEGFRRAFILEGIALEKKIDAQKIKWDPAYEQFISMKEICQFMDEDATALIQENDELFKAIHQSVLTIHSK